MPLLRRVLFICRYFPPRWNIGAVRSWGLARYLPQFGWETVLFVPPLEEGHWPDEVRVAEAEWSSLGYRIRRLAGFSLPWPRRELEDLVRREGIKAILSTSTPMMAHRVGAALKNALELPWMADLRDLWSQNHFSRRGAFGRWRERREELRVLAGADALDTVTAPGASQLAALHRRPVWHIANGFDPETVRPEGAPGDGRFTLCYTGSLYAGRQSFLPLLKALAILRQDDRLSPGDLALRIFSPPSEELRRQISSIGVEDLVIQEGMVSRDRALEAQRRASVLVLLNWEGSDAEGIMTGKIFEYLAARRPILAVGGNRTVATDLVARTETGYHENDPGALAELLRHLRRSHCSGGIPFSPRKIEVEACSQVEMARKVGAVLDALTGKGDASWVPRAMP